MSNVSFGISWRNVVNGAFVALLVKAGADGGIIGPAQFSLAM